jgi:cytochrome c oxidase subunit 2
MIVLEWLFLTIARCDAAEPWQLGSQDAATPMMQGIMDLHHDIFFFLILILVFVSWILVRALWHFHYQKNPIPQRIVHGTTIEILRTIFPSIIPMFIAIPSFALLYSMDEVVVDPAITIKAIGHRAFGSYHVGNGLGGALGGTGVMSPAEIQSGSNCDCRKGKGANFLGPFLS